MRFGLKQCLKIHDKYVPLIAVSYNGCKFSRRQPQSVTSMFRSLSVETSIKVFLKTRHPSHYGIIY